MTDIDLTNLSAEEVDAIDRAVTRWREEKRTELERDFEAQLRVYDVEMKWTVTRHFEVLATSSEQAKAVARVALEEEDDIEGPLEYERLSDDEPDEVTVGDPYDADDDARAELPRPEVPQ